MPDWSAFALFLVAAVALLLTPSAVVLYTVTRTIARGRRAGLVSRGTVGLGDLCHVMAATLGLSASSAYARLVGTMRAWLDGSGHFRRRQRALPGGGSIGLGMATALAGTAGK